MLLYDKQLENYSDLNDNYKMHYTAGIGTWLSADQSSPSRLTESSFIFDSCLIHRGTVMLE